MTGETELRRLLAKMAPELQDGEFVFCTLAPGVADRLEVEPVGRFREAEGASLVLKRQDADRAGLACESVFRMITLRVHSDLDAVGFLAAIAGRLASAGIAVNPVSAYYHDHLFVPTADADRALALLADLSGEAR